MPKPRFTVGSIMVMVAISAPILGGLFPFSVRHHLHRPVFRCHLLLLSAKILSQMYPPSKISPYAGREVITKTGGAFPG